MTLSFTFNLLFAIAALGGILALIDGIIRVRGRAAILAVIEIIVAALFLLSLFVSGIPFGSLVLAIVLIVVLLIQLVLRGSTRRGGVGLTIVALILLAIWIVLAQGWIIIPGING